MKKVNNKVYFSAKVGGEFVGWDAEYPHTPAIEEVERTRLELEGMIGAKNGARGPVVLARLDMVSVVQAGQPEAA